MRNVNTQKAVTSLNNASMLRGIRPLVVRSKLTDIDPDNTRPGQDKSNLRLGRFVNTRPLDETCGKHVKTKKEEKTIEGEKR
ncbi:hypothetical protein LBW89_20600 [Paenibacillus sp. alder61]|uniref:Uncharacterized protein n=1 Tax=Paenibacillus faecis TaxID=862114 RepID=A0A5D0CX38_9BACL|nr:MULTISPECIES: hypothetical protein [Paenibacillus]MCA1295411.1 hypothetical protein [Paenibacillus sp. alder61]TYA14516.1 hypothetical protein FRY98_02180 [Paenibacillus faecis]